MSRTSAWLLRRHGDKGGEMKLVAFQEYVEAAEKLITENPLDYKRIGFIFSEDQDVITNAGNLTRVNTGLASQPCAVADPCDEQAPVCRGDAVARFMATGAPMLCCVSAWCLPSLTV